MKSGRFFVTYVVILAIAVTVAALAPASGRAVSGSSPEADRKAALVQEGNSKIQESISLETELKGKFDIAIQTEKKGSKHHGLHGDNFSQKYAWARLSKADRRDVQAKLARFLQLVNRILEIDAQKNIMVENRDQIVNSRESAEAFQRSLENFERENGANFKRGGSAVKPV
jgi:hypothetical protein